MTRAKKNNRLPFAVPCSALGTIVLSIAMVWLTSSPPDLASVDQLNPSGALFKLWLLPPGADWTA
jgi:hypothetical protein